MLFLACMLLIGAETVLGRRHPALDQGEATCLPFTFEFVAQFPGIERDKPMAFDFTAGRALVESHPNENAFGIVDLNRRVIFRFKDGQCNATEFERVAFFSRCMEKFQFVGNFVLGGGPDNGGLEVQAFQKPLTTGIKTVILTRRPDGKSVPTFFQEAGGDVSENVLVTDVTDTISDLHQAMILSDISECQW